jgi:exonuclease VII small subunit
MDHCSALCSKALAQNCLSAEPIDQSLESCSQFLKEKSIKKFSRGIALYNTYQIKVNQGAG